MNGEEQSLAFLKMLTPDAAEKVLSCMSPASAEKLREALNGGPPKIAEGRKAISKYEEMLSLLDRSGSPILDLYKAHQAAAEEEEPEEEPVPEITDDSPLAQLEELSCFQIANALRPEQPRIIAMLLNELSPNIAADVLALLPEEEQSKVVIEFSSNQHSPPALIERIIRATLIRGLNMPSEPPDDREQIDRLAEMLREVPKKTRSRMITAIAEEDEQLKEKLMSKLYSFEDLPSLETHIRQKILSQVDTTTLVTALFQADQEIVDSIFSVMSSRARGSLEEEMQFQTRVSEDKVEAARTSLVGIMGIVAEGGD